MQGGRQQNQIRNSSLVILAILVPLQWVSQSSSQTGVATSVTLSAALATATRIGLARAFAAAGGCADSSWRQDDMSGSRLGRRGWGACSRHGLALARGCG